MSVAINALNKRRKWPVDLGEGKAEVFIRAMTKREQRESREIAADPKSLADMTPDDKSIAEADAVELRGYFVYGVVLLNDDGSPMYPRLPDENVAAFATRVMEHMIDVPEDNKRAILHALQKAQTAPPADKLAKN